MNGRNPVDYELIAYVTLAKLGVGLTPSIDEWLALHSWLAYLAGYYYTSLGYSQDEGLTKISRLRDQAKKIVDAIQKEPS